MEQIRADSRDLWEQQTFGNSARHCFVSKVYETLYYGEIVFAEVVDFGVVFTERPVIGYGVGQTENATQEFTDVNFHTEFEEGYFPRCSGGVHHWRKNDRGFYIGAQVYAVVDPYPGSSPSYYYALDHHFTFSGIASKIIPQPDFPSDDYQD
jgi:hypothetical protein